MSSVDDEIALLAEDIRRWAGQDARIHEALEQLLKLYEAEVNALAFEALELERHLVTQTSKAENERIRSASHNQRVTWGKPVTDWRGQNIG